MSSVFETGCLSLAWKVAKVRLPNSRDKQMNHKYYYYQMLKKISRIFVNRTMKERWSAIGYKDIQLSNLSS